MIRFFDYLYYRVCKAYSGTKDSSPEFGAVCVVAAMQAFNILSCIFLFGIILHDKSFLSKFFAGSIITVLVIYNYIKYIYKENNNYSIMKERYMNETTILKERKGTFTLLYIIVSFSLFLGLAIYIGGKKW
jgi:hypothetical protein